ncbi:adenylosuccinate lyase [Candidatus Peregrinibacteria bacterium]|nr:adenylosuccinate lyase [Candidatus Peregrinibacteria bacterium]
MIDELFLISPLDGRYREKIKSLEAYFSEYALIRYRLLVELEWFIFLCNEVKLEATRPLTATEIKVLRALSTDFDGKDGERVKFFERQTNHDVKAIEYFIKEHLKAYPKISVMSEFIHFGCTSEDINNLAYGLLLKDFGTKEFMPLFSGLIQELFSMAKKYKGLSMLSHTHGQPASPTTVGKELINVVARLEKQFESLKRIERSGKFNGAVGNFNAHTVAYPKVDWAGVSHRFVAYIGLTPNPYTTQIEPHDTLAERFDALSRINTILIDFCRDMWMYISFGYFKQKLKEGEVGSSTMPHKVNPIDFENAEGNFGLANAIFRHLAEKLPISRMQRDLSDSTVQRNIGVGFGYTIVALKSLMNGLQKVTIDEKRLKDDLENNLEVLTEAIQTVLRKYKVEQAYERLKILSRGKKLTDIEIRTFIKQLKIGPEDKKRLLALTPATYTGLAEKLVDSYKLKIS